VRTARVAAQAKLNLFLRIVGREPEGYHQLSTLFQRIALADVVTVRTGVAGRSLDCAGVDVGPVEQNLAWRAAVAYAAAAGWPTGFSIEIEKHIPVGGGLGGGSADAAAVLRALDALAPRPLGEAQLAAIAFGLGADVPYLTTTFALALGTGRGERLIALPPLPPREVLLLLPSFGVASRDAFAWHAARRGALPYEGTTPLLPAPLSWKLVEKLAVNDLEEAVFDRHQELREIRETLAAVGARIARMSGSGSTVFGIFGEAGDAPARHELTGADRLVPPRDGDAAIGIDLDFLGVTLVPTATVSEVAPVVVDPPAAD
jgi:4-diphosphocytidyl-2-C-methyl-D-erythritol kinase